MSYWILIVSESAECPSRHAIEVPLYSDYAADYEVRKGTEDDWEEVELLFTAESDDDDDEDDQETGGEEEDETEGGEEMREPFATIYRKTSEAKVRAEVESMLEQLVGVQPASGAEWVKDLLGRAKSVFSATPHHPTDPERAMDALRAVLSCIRREVKGLNYAEGEGWSNGDGCLITWEFDHEERLRGKWWAAVLDADGEWTEFQMDLGNAALRRAFREGRVPDGLKPSSPTRRGRR
jgi:hypothetical protein